MEELIYYMNLAVTLDNLSRAKQTNSLAGCTGVLISASIYRKYVVGSIAGNRVPGAVVSGKEPSQVASDCSCPIQNLAYQAGGACVSRL